VAIALNLIPFAGIAFLWFIGVLRDRIGQREDRFFATVFLCNGLLFVAMTFAGAAIAGGVIAEMPSSPPTASTPCAGPPRHLDPAERLRDADGGGVRADHCLGCLRDPESRAADPGSPSPKSVAVDHRSVPR
jgi:hypothetical protein